jgi:hypothetical protein
MPEPKHPRDGSATETTATDVRAEPLSEPMGEEEKILDSRMDVNMPALLTRDVPGG